MLTPALYMLQLYDSVLTSRNEMTLLMLTLIMLGAYVFMGALEFVRSFILIRIGAQFDMKLNRRVYTAAFEQNLRQIRACASSATPERRTPPATSPRGPGPCCATRGPRRASASTARWSSRARAKSTSSSRSKRWAALPTPTTIPDIDGLLPSRDEGSAIRTYFVTTARSIQTIFS